MSNTDDDNYYYSISQDTAATSTTAIFHRFIPSGTTKTFPANLFIMNIPKSSKKTKSKWMNKKLKKMGR